MEAPPNPEEAPKAEEKPEFKKPVLIGRVGKLPKKAKTAVEKASQPKKDEVPLKRETSLESKEKPSSKSSLPPAILQKELSTPIPYKEPKWSGLCPDGSEYGLEVLKSGMIVERIDLTQKPFYVFGRLANCDVVLAHPTVSRHHCVLQYKAVAEDDSPPPGWYIQDLGSTHGTFLNRDRLKPQHYTRLRVHHQVRFGTSSRTYIVTGPDFDCEGESELSVTEIKRRALEMKAERSRMLQEAMDQRERDRCDAERRREEQGIDWGMGEDAEEEPDLADNPYAVTTNETLYLDDPKKTLRGYFEREGHELTYDCEERGVGQFLCRVELPLDDPHGRPVIAEMLHKGKKKEAVVACALEACRILDRAGLLRQAKHESRRRKPKEDDSDSDDDTFWDRTGSVERRRDRRKNRRENAAAEPLTYDVLLKQIEETEAKIATEEKSLERLRAAGKATKSEEQSEDGDSLDNFMSNLGKQGHSMAQKAEISNTKMTITKLKAELSKTQRLAEIARPAHLPPLVKKGDKSKMAAVKVGSSSVVYGKRIRLKEDNERKSQPKLAKKQDEGEFVEEMDSDEEETTIPEDSRSKLEETPKEISKEGPKPDSKSAETEKEVQETEKEVDRSKEEKKEVQKRVFGPMRPPENYVVPESYFNQESDRDLPEIFEDEV